MLNVFSTNAFATYIVMLIMKKCDLVDCLRQLKHIPMREADVKLLSTITNKASYNANMTSEFYTKNLLQSDGFQ